MSNTLRPTLTGAALLCLSLTANADLSIFTIQHRPAGELLPILQPFVHEHGVIRASGSQLIIRTTQDNLKELTDIIAELDRPPRRLLITVKQPLARESTIDSISATDTVRSFSTASRDHLADGRQIQVLEGRTAFISTGQAIPQPRQHLENGDSVTTFSSLPATTGFNVTPRLNGDHVTLAIRTHSATPSKGGAGKIDIQHAAATVSGRLGDWITISDVTEQENTERHSTIYATRSRDKRSRRILIRITELGDE